MLAPGPVCCPLLLSSWKCSLFITEEAKVELTLSQHNSELMN